MPRLDARNPEGWPTTMTVNTPSSCGVMQERALQYANGSAHSLWARGCCTLFAAALATLSCASSLRGEITADAWGSNVNNQSTLPLGLGGVLGLAAGGYHSVGLKANGTVVCWGLNNVGQCTVPANLLNVIRVAAGKYHSIAIRSNRTIKCWGLNNAGQCTIPAAILPVSEVDGGDLHSAAIHGGMHVICWGDNSSGQSTVPAGLGNASRIAAGSFHTVLLQSDRTVKCWGRNDFGQCNIPAALADVNDIDAGGNHTVVCLRNGTVVAWWLNTSGQCTVPNGLASVRRVSAGTSHTIALKRDRTIVSWGSNASGQSTPPVGQLDVGDVSAGGEHNLALTCAPPTVYRNSGDLGAIGAGTTREYTFENLPLADDTVSVTVRARADLNLPLEFLTVYLDGLAWEDIFVKSGTDCPPIHDEIALPLSSANFGGLLLPDRALTVKLVASSAVSTAQCANPYSEILLAYPLGWIDCNYNQIHDSCEVDTGAADLDNDGQLDACEMAVGDFNLDGFVIADDLADLLDRWGVADAVYGDLNLDGVIGGADLAILLDR